MEAADSQAVASLEAARQAVGKHLSHLHIKKGKTIMNKSYTIIGGIVGFFVLVALIIGGSYNSLVGAQTKVEQAQSKIETTLQRRYDLIPNVVNSVKGYMKHESDIFEHIADARAKIGSNSATKAEKEQAQGELDSAISRLLVVQENYPELKADQQVQNLITELEGTENRIFVARNDYNEVATTYNNKVRRFPTNMIAGMFGFEKVELVKADEKAKTTVPSVDLNNDK